MLRRSKRCRRKEKDEPKKERKISSRDGTKTRYNYGQTGQLKRVQTTFITKDMS